MEQRLPVKGLPLVDLRPRSEAFGRQWMGRAADAKEKEHARFGISIPAMTRES
jgi:hypothetical protein